MKDRTGALPPRRGREELPDLRQWHRTGEDPIAREGGGRRRTEEIGIGIHNKKIKKP